MKVYVVWDPLYEKVISVHKSEETACAAADKADVELHENSKDHTYDYCYGEFELLD